MGTSKTGSMVHIEPSVNAELNNLMDQLRIEEKTKFKKSQRAYQIHHHSNGSLKATIKAYIILISSMQAF